jgi:hypothetical protein
MGRGGGGGTRNDRTMMLQDGMDRMLLPSPVTAPCPTLEGAPITPPHTHTLHTTHIIHTPHTTHHSHTTHYIPYTSYTSYTHYIPYTSYTHHTPQPIPCPSCPWAPRSRRTSRTAHPRTQRHTRRWRLQRRTHHCRCRWWWSRSRSRCRAGRSGARVGQPRHTRRPPPEQHLYNKGVGTATVKDKVAGEGPVRKKKRAGAGKGERGGGA